MKTRMFFGHLMRTFQGTFHASPAYALWYGWSEMHRDLTEIKSCRLRCGASMARLKTSKPLPERQTIRTIGLRTRTESVRSMHVPAHRSHP